ncbi:hypothetical protein [Cellulosimicrobium cellulans]|uniref:Uncharacterized protein n=1 Tax=Cellulosimicrobium cellulans TaxID=1710 RepID=A0A4Y4E585_CELCE|nr:hypothetical protein [Cellulosimicrobium cellulans]GED09841.1 hypothetical protein CCE02nite_18400 [Cellulosimicrobium cellulans]
MTLDTPHFFSDRVSGPTPRTADALPPETSTGLVNLVEAKIDQNWFAHRFPLACPDGQGVAGTAAAKLGKELRALIPGLEWPQTTSSDPTDEQVLDLVEYAARRIARPESGRWHEFYGHHELIFTTEDGPRLFREEVNLILARGGTTFELTSDGTVQRVGTPVLRQAISDLRPATGDDDLDGLILESRRLYTSRKYDQRRLGLERLWDAFERLKTIDIPGGDKKKSLQELLAHIGDPKLRNVAEAEMNVLTEIGNTFSIRHHETRTSQVPAGARDYLYTRAANLITFLLTQSNRLA